MTNPSSQRTAVVAFLLICAAAALFRIGLWTTAWNEPLQDPDGYLPLARGLAAGEGFQVRNRPTAYRPPLYPIVLAFGIKLGLTSEQTMIAILHVVLGSLTTALTISTAKRWGLTPVQTWIAGLITALDPVLAIQTKAVMTETLATFLVALALRLLAESSQRGFTNWGAGVVLGLCSLCRPSFLPWAFLTLLARFWLNPGSQSERWRSSLSLSLGLLVVLAPWAVRNRLQVGDWIWTTTHGGYTLLLANNPEYYGDVLHGPPGAVWSGPNQEAFFERVRQETKGMSEPQANHYLSQAAMRIARERPQDFAKASMARLGRFWGLAPSSAVYSEKIRWICAVWTLPIWISVTWSLFQSATWKSPRIFAILVSLALTLVHTIYWTDLRMRAPLIPALGLLAASAKFSARSSVEK